MPSRLSIYIKTSMNLIDAKPDLLPTHEEFDEIITKNPVQIRKQNKQKITPDNKKDSTKKSPPKAKEQKYITPFPDDIEEEINRALLDNEIISVDLNSIGEEEE